MVRGADPGSAPKALALDEEELGPPKGFAFTAGLMPVDAPKTLRACVPAAAEGLPNGLDLIAGFKPVGAPKTLLIWVPTTGDVAPNGLEDMGAGIIDEPPKGFLAKLVVEESGGELKGFAGAEKGLNGVVVFVFELPKGDAVDGEEKGFTAAAGNKFSMSEGFG